jgi:hypothetical protein
MVICDKMLWVAWGIKINPIQHVIFSHIMASFFFSEPKFGT